MEYGIGGLIVLILNVYAIYQVITSGATTAAKVVWTLAILILPILGFTAWLIAGPRGGSVRV
ncbi:MAG: PLD nuclease N-terminal domain-containing protein [Pseudomonadota bacterium]